MECVQKAWENVEQQKAAAELLSSSWSELQKQMNGIKEDVEKKEAALTKREQDVSAMETSLQERMKHHQTTVKALRSEQLEEEEANINMVATQMSSQNLRKAVFVAELREAFETGKATTATQRLIQSVVDNKAGKDNKAGGCLKAAVTGALCALPDPGHLVIQALNAHKCFPAHKSGSNSAQQNSTRKALSILLECLAAMQVAVSEEVKTDATTILAAWQTGLNPQRLDAQDCYTLVMLVTAFGLQASADPVVLMSCVKELTSRKQLCDIVTGVGMADNVSELVSSLVEDDKVTEAVTVVIAFELTEKHSPRQLVEDMVAKLSGDEAGDDAHQMVGIKQVLRCIKQHATEFGPEGLEQLEALVAPLKNKMAGLQTAATLSKKRPTPSVPNSRGKKSKGATQRMVDPNQYRAQQMQPMYMQQVPGQYAHNGSGLARAMMQDTSHQYTGLAQQLNMATSLPVRYF